MFHSKVQVHFSASDAALLSVGLLEDYSSIEELQLAAEKDAELLPLAELALDIQRQLQFRIDDFKYLGQSLT